MSGFDSFSVNKDFAAAYATKKQTEELSKRQRIHFPQNAELFSNATTTQSRTSTAPTTPSPTKKTRKRISPTTILMENSLLLKSTSLFFAPSLESAARILRSMKKDVKYSTVSPQSFVRPIRPVAEFYTFWLQRKNLVLLPPPPPPNPPPRRPNQFSSRTINDLVSLPILPTLSLPNHLPSISFRPSQRKNER